VASSTPGQDYRLHVRAWQHHFAAVFGHEALSHILALLKTQGSDTKLVAQMQPYYEAKGLGRWQIGGVSVPPLVTEIADGENGRGHDE
jgi:hypothetical protein